jgi:Flp pilus assembly pilin Flp
MATNGKTQALSLVSRASLALARLRRDQRGASFVEYVIVVGLIAIVCIAAFGDFGTAINETITNQAGAIRGMGAGGGGAKK